MKNILKLILALVFTNIVVAQNEPNDCVNAIIVCGNGSFTSNANGSGNNQEVNACGGFENNSLWIKINVVQGGTLGFNLIPDDPSIVVDYDFWVFGPNPNCTALGAPIRCSTTNPLAAGLSNNITGMNGSTLVTQAGPGPDGNGFVRWLTVIPGQSYYIVIDRPVGDGGFQIQWTGSAMSGTGAFTTPPTVNSIADVLTCSNTPNVGIYNLDTVRSLINTDTTNNTISFHTSLEDANDNANPLPDIYANISNPQTIFVRVTNNVSGCYNTTDFDLVVNLVPNASLSLSDTDICSGDSVTATFTGTPNATFDYILDGGSIQTAILSASGTFTITETPTTDRTYTLTGVRVLDGSGTVICSQPLSQMITVIVNPIPTVTISGTTTICSGATTVITFTGTPNATVTYTVDGGSNQTILLDNTGSATLTTPVLTLNSTYSLVSIISSGTSLCSQSQTGSAIITIGSLPTVTISGTTSICSGATTQITFTGTPNATVTYTVDGGSNQTIVLDGTGSAIITTPVLTNNSTYDLVSVSLPGTPLCVQSQTGSAVISISPTPTASISGTTTICSGETATITFTGTANATVTYTINSGSNQTIVLDGTGVAVLTPTLTADTTYALVNVSLAGTPPCSQIIVGSAVVDVLPMPTVTILGTTSICSGDSTTISFNGTPNATVTYTINGGSNQTITTNSTGNAVIVTGPLTSDTTYSLVSIIDNSGTMPVCTQTLSGNAVVTVNSIPVITTVLPNQIVCSDDIVITNPFVSLPSGATFTWTNTNPAIGLPASGMGNIPNFTASNTTSLAISATIDVLATSNGCSSSQSFTIIVNPRPFANPTITDYALC
ncbi:MAG TPA: hypothetical protein PLH25_02525, partial [Flavobacterium sp.]|nr:hypothetical protein [Flavobacterium sp.]